MNTPRYNATTTLLPNGQVLVVGGVDNLGATLASAELYNPATGTWSLTSSMILARQLHTATLLQDGKVLISGGVGTADYLAEAELYDPSIGTWSTTGSMNASRYGFTATLLSNGNVLVAGGLNSNGPNFTNYLAEAELYDPSTGTWSPTGSMNVARNFHSTTLLSNGQALVAGGINNTGVLASAELYDPSSGTWTLTGSMNVGRADYPATLLPSGQVLVAGGFSNGSISSAELFRLSLDSAPTITSASSYSTGMRQPITPTDFTITTTGTPVPTLTESGTLPSGLSFLDNGDGTANFTGQAASGTNGTYPITITADNSTDTPATQRFVLTVTTATSVPAITSDTSDTETFGVPFSFTMNTSGYPAPALTKTGALPSGVTFTDNGDGTAAIAGTPAASAVGVYMLTIKAKSSTGTTTQSFTLTITKAPVIKNISTKTAHVGTAFSMTVKASGYTTPALTESGTLPNGITFTDNGNGTATLSGTPAVGSGGAYSITVIATNQLGSSSQTFTLKVNEAPVITSAASTSANQGSPFTFQVTTTGFPIPSLSKSGTLPKGVTFQASTGTLSGTPKSGTAGSYPITITARNSSGLVTQNFVLTIN